MKADPANRAKLQEGKLIIKGRVQSQFLKPSLPEVPKSAECDISDVTSSEEKAEGGSPFKVKVINRQDIAHTLKFLFQRHEVAAATHIVYAYRLHGHNKVEENFDSDRDGSCGLELPKAMRTCNLLDTLFYFYNVYYNTLTSQWLLPTK